MCQAETFMHDDAPAHRSRSVKQWLDDCAVNYITDWPSNSPDLNCIENVWALMKKEFREKDTSSVLKLKAALLSVWKSLKPDFLHNIVDSFPCRLQAFIKKKGFPTKY